MRIDFIAFCLVFTIASAAQRQDSIVVPRANTAKFNYKQLIIPAVLIGYGFVDLKSDQLIGFNTQISRKYRKISMKKYRPMIFLNMLLCYQLHKTVGRYKIAPDRFM